MGNADLFRRRLPCVGLFLWAAIGVLAGRWIAWPGWVFAVGALPALAAGCLPRVRGIFPLGIALAFAAAQTWQYRESPAAALAARLSTEPEACEAIIAVLDNPRAGSNPSRCHFSAQLEMARLDGREIPANCPVLVRWDGAPPAYGDVLRVQVSLSNCTPPRNPGEFDYAAWLANGGIRSQLEARATDAKWLAAGGNPVVRFAHAARRWIEQTLSLGIADTPEATLIKAMTVGDVSDASDALKDDFRETGTFHLFSVSGLHVAIVGALLWGVCGMAGFQQRHTVLIVIPCLFFYALLTGLSAASVRAAIMLSVLAGGLLLDRAAQPLNSVGAAGFLILCGDSSQLFNSGFQLSFGAVALICLVAVPLNRALGTLAPPPAPENAAPSVLRNLRRAWKTAVYEFHSALLPDPYLPTRLISFPRRVYYATTRAVLLLFAVSFAAWIATAPLVAYYFHLVSLSSIPANLLAVPLSSLVLALAAVALVAGLFSPWLAEIFNQANFLLAKLLLLIVHAFAAIPGSSIYVSPIPEGDRLVALDVGTGAAVAVFSEGWVWLIDCGSRIFADEVTVPFLRSRGVNRLDGLVLTHGDSKHIGGFERIAESFHPREVLASGLPDRSPAWKHIFARHPDWKSACAGKTFPLGTRTRISFLYPPPEQLGRTADDKALVIRIEMGGLSALLTSDSGPLTEQWLLAHARERLPCDVLVMGRHISGLSGDPEFLRAAQPRAIITTAAKFPESEQIPAVWAHAVESLQIPLWRQDESGAVSVTVGSDSFTVSPYLPVGRPARTFPILHAADSLR